MLIHHGNPIRIQPMRKPKATLLIHINIAANIPAIHRQCRCFIPVPLTPTRTSAATHGCRRAKPVAGSTTLRALQSTSSVIITSMTCQVRTPARTQPVTVFSCRPQAMCI